MRIIERWDGQSYGDEESQARGRGMGRCRHGVGVAQVRWQVRARARGRSRRGQAGTEMTQPTSPTTIDQPPQGG